MVSFSLCNARCITAWAACETTRARDEGSLVSPDVCNQREGVCRAACEGGDAHLEAVVEDADQLDAPVHYTWTCTRPTDEDEAAAEAGERCFDRNVGTGVDVKLCGLFDSSTP